ncbi:LOW QUALITY PROTEIN: hypothetical protein PHPALM_28464 [Phytophthora palmivora]|uniref:Uncharacterized protein n=1 Tax=Phytophthora palmivora TaxID=4796 RepID=A0A2P4XA38_9STRA|nr:LOW QUALITY PROTEIN: hypothetical protein PHPALM_28464 [Phytophthora palmivora]
MLAEFVEIVRGQTAHDYRPNNGLVPDGYQNFDNLPAIAREGDKVYLKKTPPRYRLRQPNHGSTRCRGNILPMNKRKEQDVWRCLVLDADLLDQWSEIIIGLFGVVDKGGNDASMSRLTTHESSNQSSFRNISIHSNSVYLFAGQIELYNILVIKLSARFGTFYRILRDCQTFNVTNALFTFISAQRFRCGPPNQAIVEQSERSMLIRLGNSWKTTYRLRFSVSHVTGPDYDRCCAGSRISANPVCTTLHGETAKVGVQGMSDIW